MEVETVEFNPLKVKKSHSKERKKFNDETNKSNIVYLFFGSNKCYYIGETDVSLHDRCFKNTPKHTEKDWFDMCKIYRLQMMN